MKGLMRDPMIHFLLIGALVFLIFELRNDPQPVVRANIITVTEDDLSRLGAQFQALWRRPPEPAEIRRLVEEHIRDEIYYREALKLGMDRGDQVIRQRLRQKMEFLTQAGADSLTPSDEDMSVFYDAHADQFARPPRISFRQVLLPKGADAKQALVRLADGAAPEPLGAMTLLPPGMREAQPAVVKGTFGEGVFEALADLPVGEWAGPVTSSYGRHLVQITGFSEGGLPPLDEVRPLVEGEWRRAAAKRIREDQYQVMREAYEVQLPGEVE